MGVQGVHRHLTTLGRPVEGIFEQEIFNPSDKNQLFQDFDFGNSFSMCLTQAV